MNKEIYQLALNLKNMLTLGKTFLEIKQKNSINEKFENRVKNNVEDFIKQITVDEIYDYMKSMDLIDMTDYNKIMIEALKQFNNESIAVIITIPSKTIHEFHENYKDEEQGYSGTLILIVCVIMALCAFLYIRFLLKN